MSEPTDRLIFIDRLGRRFYEALWNGPWPPPRKLSIMRGKQSGMLVVVDEAAPPEYVELARQVGSIEETRFRLRNASEMPEAAGPEEHWFRGAEYVPESDDA